MDGMIARDQPRHHWLDIEPVEANIPQQVIIEFGYFPDPSSSQKECVEPAQGVQDERSRLNA